MIRDFEHIATVVGEVGSLEELRQTTILIDAADYIETRILRGHEPLLPALGGLPFSLGTMVQGDLAQFAQYNIEPCFIFNGIDLRRPADPFQQRRMGTVVNEKAWSLYERHKPEESVMQFKDSLYVQPEDLSRALQSILTEHKVQFLTAPYSALPQMVYMLQNNLAAGIAGPSELLLFPGADRFITAWDFGEGQFRFIQRGKCVMELKKVIGNAEIPDDVFVDACMLAGSDFLPTLPSLETPPRNKMPKPFAAIDAIWSSGRTGISAVQSVAEDPRLKEVNYLDNFRKARMAIKHQPIYTKDGAIENMNYSSLAGEAHEFLGQNLPAELYHYLSRGLIDPRVLSWRAKNEIIENVPVDGGNSVEYQKLVGTKLIPYRKAALQLLTTHLHNWFQHNPVKLKCWFQDTPSNPATSVITMDQLDETKKIVGSWNVKEETFAPVVSTHETCGLLGSAVLALQDQNFVSKSVSAGPVRNSLSSEKEVLYNSLWRFLAIRGYVDATHNLTDWGKMLAAVIAALKGNRKHEEAALLAVELLRLDMLNGEAAMFPYQGAPLRGDDTDRKYSLLVSRLAGLGTPSHRPIGYTGPLSRHLLGYNSVIEAVRSAVRDIVETSATQMFLSGAVDREAIPIQRLAVQLPFLLPNHCGLSIAMKTYLDELINFPVRRAKESKEAARDVCAEKYFPQITDFAGDLESAFHLWDAVFSGVKQHSNLFKDSDRKTWTDANEWFEGLR